MKTYKDILHDMLKQKESWEDEHNDAQDTFTNHIIHVRDKSTRHKLVNDFSHHLRHSIEAHDSQADEEADKHLGGMKELADKAVHHARHIKQKDHPWINHKTYSELSDHIYNNNPHEVDKIRNSILNIKE